jgi:hypothetical protein
MSRPPKVASAKAISAHIGFDADVGAQERCASSLCLDQPECVEATGFIDIGNRHGGAFARQTARDGTSRATASGSGHDGDFSVKVHYSILPDAGRKR